MTNKLGRTDGPQAGVLEPKSYVWLSIKIPILFCITEFVFRSPASRPKDQAFLKMYGQFWYTSQRVNHQL